jgi:ring-1,2-phenylacetyl-CoA epoxidase subunit PaaE
MAENVKKGLKELSVPELNIKTELFFTNEKKNKKQKFKVNKSNKSKVEILIDGTRRFLHMNTEDDFLDKASQAGINIPFSCKNGMCATCRCRVKEGKVRMKKNYSLEQWEIEQGFTLSCQLEPLDDNILLDFDVV